MARLSVEQQGQAVRAKLAEGPQGPDGGRMGGGRLF